MKTILHAFVALAAITIPLPAAAADSAVTRAIAAETRSETSRALDESRQPASVLEFAGLSRGDTVADIMAGGGYFTELIAAITGKDGTVYAINPKVFHNSEAWEALTRAHANIRVMPVDAKAMQLAPASVDTIFTHLIFHDLYWESEQYEVPRLDVDFMLANWFAAVRPGGTVIVVDHVGSAGSDPREAADEYHRIDPAAAVAAMQRAGFQLAEQAEFLRNPNDDYELDVFNPQVRGKTDRFVMKFRKPE